MTYRLRAGPARRRADRRSACHGRDRLRAGRDAVVRRGGAPRLHRGPLPRRGREPGRPADEVLAILDEGDRLSPLLDVFSPRRLDAPHHRDPPSGRWARPDAWNRSCNDGSSARDGTARPTSYERYWRRQLQPAIDRVLDGPTCARASDVVDVACGTGMVTLARGRRGRPDRPRARHRPVAEDGRRARASGPRAAGSPTSRSPRVGAEDLGRRRSRSTSRCARSA